MLKKLLDLQDESSNEIHLEIPISNISEKEVSQSLKFQANNKASSLDLIFVKLLKCRGEVLVKEMSQIINLAWNIGKVPDKLKCGAIIRMPKNGNGIKK